MKRYLISSLVISLAIIFVAGCAQQQQGPSTRVTRMNPNQAVDLSGNWNDVDANQVAATMIRDCLSRPWAAQFKQEKGRVPVVRLYPIKNRTAEHINWRFFTKQVEMELLNSGMVKVVADYEEAQDNRFERADQAQHASDKTVKSQGNETGSDFIFNGWIITQNDAVDGQEVRSYITTMEVSNSESNEKVWMKIHPIKKFVQRAASQW